MLILVQRRRQIKVVLLVLCIEGLWRQQRHLTAANCTVSVWEGFQATINNIVASQTLIRENSDLVIPVKTTKAKHGMTFAE
jgi:hypothetical protein